MRAYSGRWAHVVGVYSGLTRWLYVDGCLVSELTWTNAFTPYQRHKLRIGHNGVWSPDISYWKGKIDDVRLYYTALDSLQIADLYDALGDLDGDGTNTLQEYLLGANPTNTSAEATNPASPPVNSYTGTLDHLTRYNRIGVTH